MPDHAGAKVAAPRPDRHHAEAIESSLEIAALRGGDLTPRVYTLLFARTPQLRTLFARDWNDAIKGEMLMKVIEAILDFVGERRYAHHLIGAEAMNHEGYEVSRAVFATFFDIVAEVVRESCRDDWTPAMAAAWARTLVDLETYVGVDRQIDLRTTATPPVQ